MFYQVGEGVWLLDCGNEYEENWEMQLCHVYHYKSLVLTISHLTYTGNLLTSGNWCMCLQPPSTEEFQGKLQYNLSQELHLFEQNINIRTL